MKEFLDLKSCVRRGNVERDLAWLQKGSPVIPLYVANGAVGGCVDEFGLHSRPDFDTNYGRTHLAHVDHYSKRHDNGGHVLRAFCNVQAMDGHGRTPGLGLLEEYHQELDLWTAACTTEWKERSRYQTRAYASFDQPQLWVWELEQDLAEKDDALTVNWEFDVRANENNARTDNKRLDALDITIEQVEDGLWRIVSKTDTVSTELFLLVEGGKAERDGSCLKVQSGGTHVTMRALFIDRHLPEVILQEPGTFLRRGDHFERHTGAVRDLWENCGMLDLPEGTPESAWWPRWTYYLRSSLSPNPSHIQVATGLNANIWAHGFPQDQWYVMTALPRLGLHDLTRAQLPYYNDDLDAYRRYTKRMCKRPGVFFPWEAPFEDLDHFELDGPTNDNAYQFHNAAYVVAMVWESFLVHRDLDFLREHADLIEGVAEFLDSNCEEGPSGYIFRNDEIPLRSQDEATASGAETVQPLCAVWGSMYVFKAYQEMCRLLEHDESDLQKRTADILATGFDFSALVREDGTMRTSATDPRPHGCQKHPPQLNPLTYVPQADWMDYEPVVQSWRNRHELCLHTREPRTLGWTFGQFAFASARMRDGAELQKDLALVAPARAVDSDWIQYYESSHRLGWVNKKAYYFTVMGLYVMALLDTMVQDYRGVVEFFPALLPRWEGNPAAFRNLHLRGGLTASGRMDGDRIQCELTATQDVESHLIIHSDGRFVLEGETNRNFSGGETVAFRLKAGEKIKITST
ncbi:MAG: hypothetical protein ACOC2L_01165 [Candidatus Sumerlaeota bacterium]